MITHLIELAAASDYDRENYGVTHSSVHVYRMGGPGLHNRHHPHRVVVWDNTSRPLPDAGRYLDPSNRETDSPISVVTSAEPIAITDNGTNTGTVASGQVYSPHQMCIGDFAVLIYPDGSTSEPYMIERRPLADPELVPIRKHCAS